MRAKTKITEQSIHVMLEGRIDYESQDEVRDLISSALDKNKKVVVDMDDLEFVGSMGITTFVQSMIDIHAGKNATVEFINVRSEFSKIMKALDSKQQLNITLPDRKKPIYNQ